MSKNGIPNDICEYDALAVEGYLREFQQPEVEPGERVEQR